VSGWRSLSQPDLARSLNAIADSPDAFYTGWIADRIADDMAAHGWPDLARRPGGVQGRGTRAGQGHVSRLRDHLDATAKFGRNGADRNVDMLEARQIQSSSPGPPKRCTRRLKRCVVPFSIRARFWAIPDFVQVPVAKLTSKSTRERGLVHVFAARKAPRARARQGHHHRADCRPNPKTRRTSPSSTKTAWPYQHLHTRRRLRLARRHQGTGILLNNEMGDFNKKPARRPHGNIGTPPNVIAPANAC
jgi:gamma-glutamyltranspeptidase/glutathione hydrolase